MKTALTCYYNYLKIRALLVFAPVTLFHKISHLHWYSDTLRRWITPHTAGKSVRILDVGCASGYLCDYLYRSGHQVSGVDLSKSMIRAARRHNPQIDFRRANATLLPYKIETFDVVLSASVINIVSDPDRLLEQMLRVCRPKGWITFLFPVAGFDTKALHEYMSTLGITEFSRAALLAWHKYARKISVDDVNALFKMRNLRPLEPRFYLNGMIASISAEKVFVNL